MGRPIDASRLQALTAYRLLLPLTVAKISAVAESLASKNRTINAPPLDRVLDYIETLITGNRLSKIDGRKLSAIDRLLHFWLGFAIRASVRR